MIDNVTSSPPSRRRDARRDAWMVRAIGVFKIVKTLILIGAAISVFNLIHKDIADVVDAWARRLHFAPGNRLVDDLLDRFITVTTRQLLVAGFVLLAYSAMFLVEGIGLLLLKHWAEWMTVITTSGLIPIEIYETIRRPTWLKVSAVLINAAVAIYLVQRVRHEAAQKRRRRVSPN